MDKKIEACARAVHEAERAYRYAVGEAPQADWFAVHEELRSEAVSFVEQVLVGDMPLLFQHCVYASRAQLLIGVVRCMAASLGMTVVYPELPAVPRQIVDYSKQRLDSPL